MKQFKRKVLFFLFFVSIITGTFYFFENNISISYMYFNPYIGSGDVDVSTDKQYLIPGGQTIGVELKTEGILVVGLADVVDNNKISTSPAKESGMRIGDKILSVDNMEVSTTNEFVSYVSKEGIQEYNIEVERNGTRLQLLITPVRRYENDDILFGFWARDNIAGIGTVTYIDPETGDYSAIAHGITDSETEELIDIRTGVISKANITNIKAGQKGEPGEIVGYILKGNNELGNVEKNTEFGIFGVIEQSNIPYFTGDLVEVGKHDNVELGDAKLISCIEGSQKEYDIIISRFYNHDTSSDKNFIIEITDTELLSLTNGIIQGMSGSPIVQNGKLIGAVTHVFVNDPTRGYGIFIENMLESAESIG